MIRDNQLNEIKDFKGIWDLLVIGGGASGLGTALDAVSRGWKVLLVEKLDFGNGTSSRSTKLIHGGVRYLAQGNVRLVREALRERAYILEKAPHNAHLQAFIIPFYSLFIGIYYYIGLKVYDLLSGRHRIGSTRWLKKGTVIKRIPKINKNGLAGGIVYYDGQFDDARLCIDLMRTIISKGGTCINHCGFSSFIKDEKGIITGAIIKDRVHEVSHIIKTRAVVNATGVFTNKVIIKDNPKTGKLIVPSRGSHLVVDSSFLQSEDAIMIPDTSDGRVLFVIPWLGKVIIGTTDIQTKKVTPEPKVDEAEIDFMLENAGKYLSIKPERQDITAMFAGLRPLVAPKEKGSGKTKEISRGHQILRSESDLYTILGGKWTTFRKMGQDVIDRIVNDQRFESSRSSSIDIDILSPGVNVMSPLNADLILYFMEEEMAVNSEDILARRTRLLFLDQAEAAKKEKMVTKAMKQI